MPLSRSGVVARHDPVARRFGANPELVAIAHNALLDSEDGRMTFVRQRWEEALGATRVAMDALREFYPIDRDALTEDAFNATDVALDQIECAYASLDSMSDELLGETLTAVLQGLITDRAELEKKIHADNA